MPPPFPPYATVPTCFEVLAANVSALEAQVATLTAFAEATCTGGQRFNACARTCIPTCGSPTCPDVGCTPRCECPTDRPYWHGGLCVAAANCTVATLPPPAAPAPNTTSFESTQPRDFLEDAALRVEPASRTATAITTVAIAVAVVFFLGTALAVYFRRRPIVGGKRDRAGWKVPAVGEEEEAAQDATGVEQQDDDLDDDLEPTIDASHPGVSDDAPHERRRRAAWIKFYAHEGEDEKARSLGWAGGWEAAADVAESEPPPPPVTYGGGGGRLSVAGRAVVATIRMQQQQPTWWDAEGPTWETEAAPVDEHAAVKLQAAVRGRLDRTNEVLERRLARARSFTTSFEHLPVRSGEIWPEEEAEQESTPVVEPPPPVAIPETPSPQVAHIAPTVEIEWSAPPIGSLELTPAQPLHHHSPRDRGPMVERIVPSTAPPAITWRDPRPAPKKSILATPEAAIAAEFEVGVPSTAVPVLRGRPKPRTRGTPSLSGRVTKGDVVHI